MSGPLDEHYGYLADRAKVERYKAASERAVRPGQLVMDLGCDSGPLGWFDCRLFADIHMTNSPTADDRLDRPQAFFPLECPVCVQEGETLEHSHPDRIAQLNGRGEALRIVLSYCDGVRTVAEV